MNIPHVPDTTPTASLPESLKAFEDAGLNQAQIKGLIWLERLLAETKGEWASEAQWRFYADRPTIQPEHERARGFRLPEMLEKGVIVSTTAVIQVPRNGVYNDPVPLYRINF